MVLLFLDVSGHFIVLQSSGSSGYSDLLSERLKDNEAGHCFSFAYYMHGPAPPFLKIYIFKGNSYFIIFFKY